MKVWHIRLNPKQKVQLTLLHHKVLQVKIIFRLNFLNLLCLLALIHELLGLGSKKLRFKLQPQIVETCPQMGQLWRTKQSSRLPSPLLRVGMFAVFYRHSSLNSGPTLHGGVGEEKLYFPFLSWQNVILSPIVALKFQTSI